MKIDKYGQHIYSENDIFELYLRDPEIKLRRVITNRPINIPDIIDIDILPEFVNYQSSDISVADFDQQMQNDWFMPPEYKNLDIAKYVLDLCKTEDELQRAGQELLLYQERDLFPLLRYMKYLVDVMRENKIVWGVGRGSSVASFVLFLIGIHKINSLYYDLSIDEFLK